MIAPLTEYAALEIQLAICNRQANRFWRWRKLFYALKDAILREYGTFDGYDLQEWDDLDIFDCPGEIYATHEHILSRYLLGRSVFHIPTDHFCYFNYEFQIEKRSEQFGEFRQVVKNEIRGKRQHTQETPEGWAALKWLVRHYGFLLRRRGYARDSRLYRPRTEQDL